MLRFSYNVFLKQTESELLALEISFLQSDDQRLIERIKKKKDEIEWIKKKMEEDPSVLKPIIL